MSSNATASNATSAFGSAGLAAGYRARGETFDEMASATGATAQAWRTVVSALSDLPAAERALRMDRLNARVRETGIAHDLFADPTRAAQPWRVDLMPLVIGPAEWAGLEKALIQRARLFEGIIADFYGPQRLLKSGTVPASLVFGDSAFLRPCQGIVPRHGHIQFFATDLARYPDGRWRVVDSHTETPAGIGYALANRMVHTHVAGEVFSASNALRLAPFFQRVQTALGRRVDRADPSIALLTPGPHHNDFFSHAYLARYLGFLLVEGGDLRIVGERLFLKTLEGLKPIDLVVRCVAGSQSDPLELEPGGFLGPVGLVQAVRRHPDLVANAIGSSVVENRGLAGYLPRVAKELLGEELAIWDSPRWWLGEAQARQHVLENLDRMVIRPAHEGTARPGRAMPGRDPQRMTAAERAALMEDIAINGAMLVAEEKIGFGTTPSLGADGLSPKPYAVRFFVAATEDGYAVMPGGLAMTVDPSATVALSAPDGESRDVWVISDAAQPPYVSLWRPTIDNAQVQRSPRELPSRAADNLFWLGRYTESADWTLRVLRTSLSRLEEDSGPRQPFVAARAALVDLLAKDAAVPIVSAGPADAKVIGGLARQLLTSKDSEYGLPRTLDNIHRIASLSRDRLSLEAWRTLNAFYVSRRWRTDGAPVSIGESLDLIDSGLAVLAGFNGLMHENMTRNFGWSFLDMGRRLSRALNLASLLLSIFQEAPANEDDEIATLQFVLEVGDSFITYRSRYRLTPMLPLVLDLLISDETNPRSLAFQLAALSRHIKSLPDAEGVGARSEESRIILSLVTAVRVADVNALARTGPDGTRPELAALLRQLVELLPHLSDVIGRRYFNLMDRGPRWVRARSRQEG